MTVHVTRAGASCFSAPPRPARASAASEARVTRDVQVLRPFQRCPGADGGGWGPRGGSLVLGGGQILGVPLPRLRRGESGRERGWGQRPRQWAPSGIQMFYLRS